MGMLLVEVLWILMFSDLVLCGVLEKFLLKVV